MNENRPLIITLPIGVTVEVHLINSDEAQEITKTLPYLNDDVGSIVVINGLSVQDAAKYSHGINDAIRSLQAR